MSAETSWRRFNRVVWIADIAGALGAGAWLGTGYGWPWFGCVTYLIGRVGGTWLQRWSNRRWHRELNKCKAWMD